MLLPSVVAASYKGLLRFRKYIVRLLLLLILILLFTAIEFSLGSNIPYTINK